MGACKSSTKVAEQDLRNKEIDEEVKKDAKSRSVKMLLLGTGESGKSTVLKQMRILRIGKFGQNELRCYRGAVFAHTIYCMYSMVQAVSNFRLDFEDKTCENHSKVICEIIAKSLEKEPFSDEVKQALTTLWSDQTIQKVYEQRSQFQLNDSAKYFLDNLEQISKSDYMPTEDDALRVRVQTTGVVEMLCDYKRLVLRVIDVGGQRSERRKWIHHFDCVDCIIFVVGLSEYDQVMREDERVNRVKDTLEVFGSICQEKWFEKSSIVVFLNKIDLFTEKIKTVPLKIAFPEYEGNNNCEECVDFVSEKLRSLAEGRSIEIYETCATDKKQVQTVLDKVTDIVMDGNLRMVVG